MIRNKNPQGGQGVQEEAQGGLPSKNFFSKTCLEASDDLISKISSKVSKVYPMIRNKAPRGPRCPRRGPRSPALQKLF